MISSFNLTKLNELLKDFYTLTQIRITVFDENFRELAAYPENRASFCQIIREDPVAEKVCTQCDMQACGIAAKRHTSYTYRCHAGLTESITPLYLGNIMIGYLFFGHVFSYDSHESGWEKIKELCAHYNVDMRKLKTAVWERPLTSKNYIQSASHILQAVATYLCMERMVDLRHEQLPVQIDEYISRHFTENIDASHICEHFRVGKTHLYEISRQNYGMGIAEHIRNLRIEKAKQLLKDSELPLSEIAAECGFKDYNYFITVFKKIVGVPPKTYSNIEK